MFDKRKNESVLPSKNPLVEEFLQGENELRLPYQDKLRERAFLVGYGKGRDETLEAVSKLMEQICEEAEGVVGAFDFAKEIEARLKNI